MIALQGPLPLSLLSSIEHSFVFHRAFFFRLPFLPSFLLLSLSLFLRPPRSPPAFLYPIAIQPMFVPRRPDAQAAAKELKTNLLLFAAFCGAVRAAPFVLHALANRK